LGFLQPVGIAFEVAEFQRVGDRLGQFDAVVCAVVEHHLQPLLHIDPQMMVAMLADEEVFLQVPVENHLSAVRAFEPQIVRLLGLLDQRLEFRPDEIGKPVHYLPPPPRTHAASSRT
jgi:hypothetical protein